jgi:hypothetical protein
MAEAYHTSDTAPVPPHRRLHWTFTKTLSRHRSHKPSSISCLKAAPTIRHGAGPSARETSSRVLSASAYRG